MKSRLIFPALLVALMVPTSASAQFSDSYNFLKAIRDRSKEGNKAITMMQKPGTVIIDTKDITTGETALHIVTKERDLTWINYLLGLGARPDIRDGRGNTPLMIATQIRFVEGAQALIKRRAQVDLANSGGETPLMRAVQQRDLALVRLLLNAGANPDRVDSMAGLSARDYAKRDTRGQAILKIIEEPRAKPAAVSGPKL
jgi:uncharacterized protein